MRILVTGAGGFIGGHLVADLAARGFEVFAHYRRPPGGGPASGLARPRTVVGDLPDAHGLPQRLDAVVHFGATSPAPGITAARIVLDNVTGTHAAIEYAGRTGAACFVFASSLSVYGRIARPVVDETTPRIDPNLYGDSKFLGEAMLAERAREVPALAVRLPGVIGRGAKRNFLADTLERLLRDEPVEAYNPDAPFNNAVYVGDLAAMVAGVIERGLRGFDMVTLAARGEMTVRAVVERLTSRARSRSELRFRTSDRLPFTVSSERAMARYGYDPMEIGAMLDRYVDDTLAGSA